MRNLLAGRRRQLLAGGLTAGALIAAPLLAIAAPATAATSVWDKVAMCEASGRWDIDTGNGYYGGLQFSPGTWKGYGGLAYGKQANLATRLQQIKIGQKTLAGQGPGAWPTCSKRAGLTRQNGAADDGTGTSPTSTTPAATPTPKPAPTASPSPKPTAKPAPKPAPRPAPKPKPKPTPPKPKPKRVVLDYTVVSGDTLRRIAYKEKVAGGWKVVWEKNRKRVPNPDIIYIGQKLDVK
jgi:cell division septation protein DedD